MQFYKITILLSFNGKVFFYIFIKIIVCHFIYIFAKSHENINIMYILFKKWCPQHIRFCGCLLSYFCSVLQKSTSIIIIWMCFCILWKYICCQFCIFPFPKQKRSKKSLKKSNSVLSTGPSVDPFFYRRSGSRYRNNIF